MLDKFTFSDLVRYLLTGAVTALLYVNARDMELQTIMRAVSGDSPMSVLLSSTIGLGLIFLVGYIVFTIYYGLCYDIFILRLKCFLGQRVRCPSGGPLTYREYLTAKLEQHRRLISPYHAEHVYRLIRNEHMQPYYEKTGISITTGLHFLYCLGVQIFIAACLPSTPAVPRWLMFISAFVLIVIALWMDLRFEAFELLMFQHKRALVSRTIRELIAGGMGGPAEKEDLMEAKEKDAGFYWAWLKHSDHLFGVRSGVFLLAHTVLLPFVFGAAESGRTIPRTTLLAAHPMFVLGALLSAGWFWYCRNASDSRKYISDKLEGKDTEWAALRTKKRKAGRIKEWGEGALVAYLPPVIIFIIWIVAWSAWW